MAWRKLGLVWASGDRPWRRSHASLPVPLHLDGDTYRVFFAARDDQNRSSIGALTIEVGATVHVVSVEEDPVLAPGPLGHFDDHGVYPASLVREGERVRLYYIGWNPGVRRPLFYSSVGLALGEAGRGAMVRASTAPIMARSEWDPCLVTSPCVLCEEDRWRMWYVSGFQWTRTSEGLHSYYHVKYAESADGVEWKREGRVCIDLNGSERNIARPCVVRDADRYRMWYSYDAGSGYRIGYAESADGLAWTRLDDQAGIAPSESGWDSDAQAYPWVFTHGGVRYMLYNGNGFGRTGFGAAIEDPA
ncbi:MAG: hypothetical protein ACT4QD_00155 [Acidobacteriota bacterium]